jgi:hypothetical protein
MGSKTATAYQNPGQDLQDFSGLTRLILQILENLVNPVQQTAEIMIANFTG